MKTFLKILIVTILLSCGTSWGFKNYKNSLISSESSEEISSESKEKSGDETEDFFVNTIFKRDLNIFKSTKIIAAKTEKKFTNFTSEVPTSPPNC